MNAKKREFIVGHLGEDETKRLESNTEQLKAALEKAGVEWKDVPEDDEPGVIQLGDEATKEIATQAAKAAAEALVETPAFKGLIEAQEANEARFKGIEDVIAELKKTDDEKVAELVGASARTQGYRASASEQNLVKKDDPAFKETPNMEFFDQIMEGLEIRE